MVRSIVRPVLPVLTLALAFCACEPSISSAQMFLPTRTTQIQIEYREPMPADGDMSALRMKIYAEVQKDCDAASKAFQARCTVANISFNDAVIGNNQPPTGVIARANLTLATTSDAK